MTTTANIMPKSLHTVTVLVQIARREMQQGTASQPHDAVQIALRVLYGRDIPADTYGLAVTAARKLSKEIGRAG